MFSCRHVLIAAALLAGLQAAPAAPAAPKPDLRIGGMSVSVHVPTERLVVTASVVNAGRARARASTLRLSFAGRAESLRIPALGRGARFFRRVRLPVAPGRYAVVACADASRRVAESSERNNCARPRRVSLASPPPPPSILVRPAELTNATTAHIEFQGRGALECRLDAAGFAPCTSPVEHAGLVEGAHEFQVRARDRHGRRGEAATTSWRIDLTPPAPPRLADHPRSLTNLPQASFTFETEAGARLACRLNDSAFFACGRAESWHLPEGSYELVVRATDAAGNEGPAERYAWRIDLTAPPAPFVTVRPPAETYVRSARLDFQFPAATEPTTRECRYDGAGVPCTGPLVLAGPLKPGRHTLSLVARDDAGNEASATASWTILPRADGVYAGPGGTTPVAAFEAWRGTPAGYALEYLRRGTWQEIEGADVVSRWRNAPYRLVLSTPMLPDSGATLETGATGAYNHHFQALAQKLVAEGQEDAVIRLGWEFNGDWYPWSAVPNPAAFKATWRHVVATMRGVAGARFSFDWCPNSGPSRMNAELAYPGDDVVDYIGLSAFDAAWEAPPSPTPEWRWTRIRDQFYGLAWQRDFAWQHGKPMSYPEWGLWAFSDPSYYAGGGSDGKDDPYYVERMFEWLNSNEVAYALYFQYDSPVGLHHLGNFPLAQARYRALFGSL